MRCDRVLTTGGGFLLASGLGACVWGALAAASPVATGVLAGLTVIGIPVWAVVENYRPLPDPPVFVQHKSPKPRPLIQVMPAVCDNPECSACYPKAVQR